MVIKEFIYDSHYDGLYVIFKGRNEQKHEIIGHRLFLLDNSTNWTQIANNVDDQCFYIKMYIILPTAFLQYLIF